jgi:hypothetical protein
MVVTGSFASATRIPSFTWMVLHPPRASSDPNPMQATDTRATANNLTLFTI